MSTGEKFDKKLVRISVEDDKKMVYGNQRVIRGLSEGKKGRFWFSCSLCSRNLVNLVNYSACGGNAAASSLLYNSCSPRSRNPLGYPLKIRLIRVLLAKQISEHQQYNSLNSFNSQLKKIIRGAHKSFRLRRELRQLKFTRFTRFRERSEQELSSRSFETSGKKNRAPFRIGKKEGVSVCGDAFFMDALNLRPDAI